MNNPKVKLVPLEENERENFITEIQAAFKKAAVEEFGNNGKEILPREDVTKSFDAEGSKTYKIVYGENSVGGVILKISPDSVKNELLLFYIKIDSHGKGYGSSAWKEIEKFYPETKVWETFTPYFEKRNIHFYVNKCGFHIVEFYNPKNPLPEPTSEEMPPGGEYFFRFEKIMTK